MKIKTRLAVAFLTITIVPIFLIYIAVIGLSNYQIKAFQKAYGLNEQVELFSANSMQVFNRLTQNVQRELRNTLAQDPEKLEEREYLDKVNTELKSKYSYLIVRYNDEIVYSGNPEAAEGLYKMLPEYRDSEGSAVAGFYLDGQTQHLIKQMDFQPEKGVNASIFIITRMDDLMPEIKSMLTEMMLTGVLIILLTGVWLVIWVYHSIFQPIGKLQQATKNIRDGNLDFTLEAGDDDEIGQLCQDFEEMRIRLKESTEEKIQYDKENKELISNISHDLKTPITAIKGYVEGILDGVASSPEKLDKYIRTIYNKANDMDRLIDELMFYSKIDTNKIPYVFSKINVASYFGDCAEEVGLDMESRNIDLGYFNYVDEDVVVIADAEQLKRVINNIISNSVKYIDKKRGIINIRIRDDGDFIQVSIEDNGKGIAAKDLPYIFDRFYRTESSRNSAQGGSGIGLSIVKKIIEDHGGRIWATSKEGIGTEIHFVLRKYQEVIQE